MGSRAFGLATDGSDTDRRGVFLAPTPLFWRFEKPPTHVEGPAEEQFGWELERFCELALRANPNILECLHSPLVEHIDDTGRELLALRGAFLSRQAHETFARYALGQRRKLEADVRTHGAPRWKHAMHLLRLLQLPRPAAHGQLVDRRRRRSASRCSRSSAAKCRGREVESWMTRLADGGRGGGRRAPRCRTSRTGPGSRTSSSAPAGPQPSSRDAATTKSCRASYAAGSSGQPRGQPAPRPSHRRAARSTSGARTSAGPAPRRVPCSAAALAAISSGQIRRGARPPRAAWADGPAPRRCASDGCR